MWNGTGSEKTTKEIKKDNEKKTQGIEKQYRNCEIRDFTKKSRVKGDYQKILFTF